MGRRVRKRTRIRLATASMPVREVQKIKAEYPRPLNQGLLSAGSATPFESLVDTVYKTTALPLLASNRKVVERIQRLRTLTVAARAGRATTRYRAVKSDGPDDLVFQSVQSGRPMRDNNILARHIKPAGRKLGIGWVNWLHKSFRMWWPGTDLNRRRQPFQGCALPTELPGQGGDAAPSRHSQCNKNAALRAPGAWPPAAWPAPRRSAAPRPHADCCRARPW